MDQPRGDTTHLVGCWLTRRRRAGSPRSNAVPGASADAPPAWVDRPSCRRAPRCYARRPSRGSPIRRGSVEPGNARQTPRPNPISAGQLALELPSALPALAIEPEWKDQQRLWGHSLHPMCSYLASFPAALAHAFIARYSRPGDVVLDPFSGRGTAPLQAAAEGRIGVGNDLNPFAHLLTAAKLEPATPAEARTRLAALRLAWAADAPAWLALAERVKAPRATRRRSSRRPARAAVPTPARRPSRTRSPSPSTRARSPSCCSCARTCACDDRTDRFLAAALTGILHGKSPSYLSTIMPNTFSMAPRYVRDFAARTDFEPPDRDVFDGLAAKLDRLYRQPLPPPPGSRCSATRGRPAAGPGGAPGPRPAGPGAAGRHLAALPAGPQVRLLQLAADLAPGLRRRAIDAALDDAHQREPYLAFLREVLADLRPALTDDGIAVLVIGDVEMDRGKPSDGASASRSASGRRPRRRRATGWPASCSTRSRPTAR